MVDGYDYDHARLRLLSTYGAGRLLCFLLSVYAFSVFGYITAAIATYFVNRDANDEEAELAGTKDIQALRHEIAALREDIRALSKRSGD